MSDHDPYCQWPRIPCQCVDFAAARADQRAFDIRQQLAERHDLRVQVKALPAMQYSFAPWVKRADVLALIDGGQR